MKSLGIILCFGFYFNGFNPITFHNDIVDMEGRFIGIDLIFGTKSPNIVE